jgi:zinc D-Ala-D-Ala carboxypeptidase
MVKISKHLSYNEVVKSYTAIKKGIDNTPSECQLKNVIVWANNIFDPVRAFIGAPLGCASIFRCDELNKVIGSSSGSQHKADNGAAGDLDSDIYGNADNEDIFNFIRGNLDFDQCICEGLKNSRVAWVHVSYVSKKENRNEILMMYIKDGTTHYEYYSKERFKELLTNQF